MPWIAEHWDEVLAAAGAVHILSLFIVNLTPTPKDDEFVGKVYRWIETFAGLLTREGRGVK